MLFKWHVATTAADPRQRGRGRLRETPSTLAARRRSPVERAAAAAGPRVAPSGLQPEVFPTATVIAPAARVTPAATAAAAAAAAVAAEVAEEELN